MKQQQQTVSPPNTMLMNMNIHNIHQNIQQQQQAQQPQQQTSQPQSIAEQKVQEQPQQQQQGLTMDERSQQINNIRTSGILPSTKMTKSASAPVTHGGASRSINLFDSSTQAMTASQAHTPQNQSRRQSQSAHQQQHSQHTTIVYASTIDQQSENNDINDMIDDNDDEYHDIDQQESIQDDDDDDDDGDFDEDDDDDSEDDDGNNINDLLEGDAVLAGNYVGIIKYLGPLYLDPFNTQKITEEQYIGIECSAEEDVEGKGHDGWYKDFRYFKTKKGKKTGILIKASEFTKKLTPAKLLQTIKKLKFHTDKERKALEKLKRENKLLSF